MDDRRFDELTRVLASGASRRRVLGALAGALAAALGGRRAARADHEAGHCAKAGEKAHPHKACCPGLVPNDDDGRCEPAPASVCPGGGSNACSPTHPRCGASNECICVTTVGGGAACTIGGQCAPCDDDDDCTAVTGPGSTCAVASCCGATGTACMADCPTA